MPGGGTSSATQDTSQNSTNNATTNQNSLIQALQQVASNTLQNQMQSSNQATNQATDQATNQATNQATSQNTNQATNQLQSTNQAQTSTTKPWEAALPTVQGLLGQLSPLIANSGITPTQTSALDALQSNASQGNPFDSQIRAITDKLLRGGGATAQNDNISGNLSTLQSQLSPYASGSRIGNNPALQAQLDTIRNDVGNSVNSQFAAAGRDLSGANQQAYGRGVAQGIAPVLAQQFNQDVGNQLSAAGTLYGAGNTTAGLLNGTNQQSLSNEQAGVGSVPAALDAKNYGANQSLAVEQLRQDLPAKNLGLLAQIGIPLAGLGSTSSGNVAGSASNVGNVTGSATGNTVGSMTGNTVGNTTGNTIGSTNAVNTGSTNTTTQNTQLAQALAQLFGTSNTIGHQDTTQTKSLLDQISGWLGVAGSAAKLVPSDRRLKVDVDQVGTLFDGTPVYRYRYIGQPAFQIGLMAQDIETRNPAAVGEMNGFKAVDYRLATENSITRAA